MENKNIVLLRHQPRINVHYDNVFYTNQCENLKDYVVVDVTSQCLKNKEFMKEHSTFAKEISPMFIGPILSEDGIECKKFEIYWQCSKVYPCHDDNGKPNEDWFKWRNEWFAKETATKGEKRNPNESLGYKHGDCLYSAYYNKEKGEYEKMDYITARKKVYFKEYEKLIYNTESFKWLKSLVDEGKKLALIDFDAFNYYSDSAKKKRYEQYKNNKVSPSLTLDDFMRVNTMKDVLNFNFPAGHGVVIKALLQGDLKVDENGNVIDITGILE